MNNKTKARIDESLNKALAPPGGKEFVPLPKNSDLSRRELMDMLLENYRDVEPVNKDEVEE